jgi:hypothetical protein
VKSFAEKLIEDRRLVALRLLAEQPGRRANSSVLHMGVVHMGHTCTREQGLDDLRFLRDLRLVSMDPIADGVYGIELLGRGEDFLGGHVELDGVSRPRRRG